MCNIVIGLTRLAPLACSSFLILDLEENISGCWMQHNHTLYIF
ncbi:hypothetical protein KC19_1G160800 [Ceratodon purpureus]|uniref:Uncharacterized protein n=1 Tax=Ceratodon purpureus TaxID=3225 RepID=A0A8T0J6I9_CERPU|nr:hypothetical protein KC19_1G160800 [Ceratodon purpureus]